MDQITFAPLSLDEIGDAIDRITIRSLPGEEIPEGDIVIGSRNERKRVSKKWLLEVASNPNIDTSGFCTTFAKYMTLYLNGRNRIGLVDHQGAGDLQQDPISSFQVLFRDDAKRAELRRIVFEAFGVYLAIDPTNIGTLRLRLSGRPPINAVEERGLHAGAVEFHSKAILIDSASDGVKAFIGIMAEIIAGEPLVLLIDEPEAFLHPSLAFSLGREIATTTIGSKKRLFVSTHSPTFVMGCIQSSAPINIVRLTYRNQTPTARLLSSNTILKLMRNPLLRSTGVMSALFYESVVVTGSDADRAFYQEINERLLRFRPDWGIPNCLFLNAQNKQTVQVILRPLRELGIPGAGIVDIDILKEGGTVWSGFLDGGFVPEIEKQSLAVTRSAILKCLGQTGKNMKRDGGIDLLRGSDKEAAANLFDRLDDYGLFVVRGGEVECWLNHLGVKGHTPSWLVQVFEKMGERPESEDYVRPTGGDVWAFLSSVKGWLSNQQRKGIPG